MKRYVGVYLLYLSYYSCTHIGTTLGPIVSLSGEPSLIGGDRLLFFPSPSLLSSLSSQESMGRGYHFNNIQNNMDNASERPCQIS